MRSSLACEAKQPSPSAMAARDPAPMEAALNELNNIVIGVKDAAEELASVCGHEISEGKCPPAPEPPTVRAYIEGLFEDLQYTRNLLFETAEQVRRELGDKKII